MKAGDPDAQLPIDSDSDYPGTVPGESSRTLASRGDTSGPQGAATPAPRALHLRLGYLALVAAGGVVGTAARIAVTLVVDQLVGDADGSFPLAIFVINIVGAFILGLLLERLALRGPDVGARRITRLLVGTGVLGGFTTYSALSADSAELLTDGGVLVALVYGVTTVLVGALASWAGIALGGLTARRPTKATPTPAAAGIDADADTETDGSAR